MEGGDPGTRCDGTITYMKALLAGCVVTLLLLVAAGWLYVRHAAGFSARSQPTVVEATLARHARSAAMPAAERDRRNPIAAAPVVMQEALAHYADHCAVCHANNGDGDTMMGNGMYPRPPDMRLPATQGRTDGELFSIIENGVRMSGMPGFGGNPANEADSWKLVLFIRHLPQLTPAELAMMESLNPKGPEELGEEKQEAEFLSGDGAVAGASKTTAPTAKRK
jgi:mono/diheme cytochrome c family protein